ncbi:MAG: hypothetical protein M3R45_06145 [Pseudomonadota bacterium]|nr:hypothetical protein [Pseudomonadota bacterium]
MSVSYYIVLDNKEPGFDTFVNGKAVARASEKLDEICDQAGLPRLDSFAGQSCEELAEMLGDGFDEEMDEEGDEEDNPVEREYSDEKWFAPEDGISLVDALIAAIGQHPEIISTPEEIVDDLKEYKNVLEQAKAIHAKWHLAIDF